MKHNIDQFIDEAFADELLQLAPEPVAEQELTETVFSRLKLEAPAPKVTALPISKPKRRKARILLIAAVLVVVTAMGAVAYNEWLKLSNNKVDYYTTQSEVQNGEKTTSHDTDSPVFFQGMEAAVEKLNTPVGQSVTYQGVTITLDTVAADSNIVNLYFTATYETPIDFDTVFPDLHPGDSEEGSYPDYDLLRLFMPNFFMNIDQQVDPYNNSCFFPDSTDGYFVNDQTIRFSMLYYLPETYPDQFTIYAMADYAIDVNGNQLLDQANLPTDTNPFSFQINVDKSEENGYCRSVTPGEYVFNTQDGSETLYLNKLMISPLGATMVCSIEEKPVNDNGVYEIIGLYPEILYMEDDKGNVLDFYSDNTSRGASFGYSVQELINLSPDAESITIMPLDYDYDDESGEIPFPEPETRKYDVDGIEGQKIETSSLGGYIVKNYSVKDGSIEVELEPYGRALSTYVDIRFDDENITLAGGRSGLIRQQYNRETGIFTYAVDYYAATIEELNAIEHFSVTYDDRRTPNWDEAITLPLEAVTD